jgi:hypothetical protein
VLPLFGVFSCYIWLRKCVVDAGRRTTALTRAAPVAPGMQNGCERGAECSAIVRLSVMVLLPLHTSAKLFAGPIPLL